MIEQDFEEATADFRRFLAEHGRSTTVAWIFRDDLTLHKLRALVYLPGVVGGEEPAERFYEQGRERGLGVRLDGLFEAGGLTFASVFVPEDEGAVSAAMMRPGRLGFWLRTSPLAVRLTQSRALFATVRVVDRLRERDDLAYGVPHKHGLREVEGSVAP